MVLAAGDTLAADETLSADPPLTSMEPVDIGSRRELFVDRYIVGSLDGAELRLHHPQSAGVALRYDGPADSRFSFYTTVLKDGDVYRMYYRGYDPNTRSLPGEHRFKSVTCYAESPDGIHWTRPDLGIIKVGGSKQNNAIIPFGEPFVPFIDNCPGVPPSERYKANQEVHGEIVTVDPETTQLSIKADAESGKGLMGFVSSDGIHWKPVGDQPAVLRDPDFYNHFDGQNVMFWSEAEQLYVLFQRHAAGGELRDNGIRSIARSTSRDFLHWSDPVPMTYSDTGTTTPSQHLYVNQTQPYFRAPHIYISLPGRLQEGRRVVTEEQEAHAKTVPDEVYDLFNDVADGVLLATRAGSTFYDFLFRESFVRPGIGYNNWTTRNNYPSCGIVPTGPHEMSIYVQRNYAQEDAYLERMTLRLDGFVSVNGPYDGGEFLTKLLTFTGKALEINYSTSAAGGIQVEIQHPDGRPVEGYALEDCREIIGDEISRIVTWKEGSDVSGLSGKPVRLRFLLKDADLFSIRFPP